MKAHHYGIFFTVIALILFLTLDMKTSNVKVIHDEKSKMDRCLTAAIDDGVEVLSESYMERQIISSKEDVVEAFFCSLYNSLGFSADPTAQLKLRLYLPVLLITYDDGCYVFYNDEYKVDGATNVAMRWSEKFPYAYEDDYFIYGFTMDDVVNIYDKNRLITAEDDNPYLKVDYHEFQTRSSFSDFRKKHPNHFLLNDEEFYLIRKNTIVQMVNEKMQYYINFHNNIASQYGIAYQFSLPVIDESELLRSVEHPGMIVIFQGYPIRSTKEVYNRVDIAGAQVHREDIYYIEEKGWYKVYHTSSCAEVGTNVNIDTKNVYYDVADCVELGAFGCEQCTTGVHVPEYRRD